MARYFFNVRSEASGPDMVGEELLNDEAAWHEATLVAGELFKDIDGKFRPGQDMVARGDGRTAKSPLLYSGQRRTDLGPRSLWWPLCREPAWNFSALGALAARSGEPQ
jgi:hypothetical protein